MNLPDFWPFDKPGAIDDCVEGMKQLPEKCIDLVVTSPPYNLGMDYGDCHDDSLSYLDYLEWMKEVMSELKRVLKDDGRLCLNHYFSTKMGDERTTPLMDINYIATRELGFKHHTVTFWTDSTLSKNTAWGSYKSASSPYISSPYEGILILYKKHWKKITKGEDTVDKDTFVKGCSGAWNFSPTTDNDHPCPFPVELPLCCIHLLSFKGDIVLDPFLGSGTTLLACRMSGRNGVGFELNSDYELVIQSKSLQNIKSLEDFG